RRIEKFGRPSPNRIASTWKTLIWTFLAVLLLSRSIISDQNRVFGRNAASAAVRTFKSSEGFRCSFAVFGCSFPQPSRSGNSSTPFG
ncbi:MAG TPA: hypothetical protein VJ349_25610, partial [Stellaceae bacterium]|nr:hypothetical protein [Stellaceae bacterium]